jgi:hypothetical protein
VVATGCPLIGGAAWSLVQDRSPRPSLSPGTLSRKCRHGLAEKARDRRRVEVEHLGASELFRGGSDRGRGLGYRVAAPRKSRPSAARERLPRHYETPRFVAPSGALARSASDPTSPTTAIFSRRKKYCHNGGMAFAHHHGVGLPGVHDGDHGPFRRSLETGLLQGKTRRGPGSALFGGSNGLVCLSSFFSQPQEVLPQRGHDLRP